MAKSFREICCSPNDLFPYFHMCESELEQGSLGFYALLGPKSTFVTTLYSVFPPTLIPFDGIRVAGE